MMYRHEAMALYNNSYRALSDALGITREAIHMWPKDKPIPEKHVLKLRFILRPEAFFKSGKLKRTALAA